MTHTDDRPRRGTMCVAVGEERAAPATHGMITNQIAPRSGATDVHAPMLRRYAARSILARSVGYVSFG